MPLPLPYNSRSENLNLQAGEFETVYVLSSRYFRLHPTRVMNLITLDLTTSLRGDLSVSLAFNCNAGVLAMYIPGGTRLLGVGQREGQTG